MITFPFIDFVSVLMPITHGSSLELFVFCTLLPFFGVNIAHSHFCNKKLRIKIRVFQRACLYYLPIGVYTFCAEKNSLVLFRGKLLNVNNIVTF